MVVWLIFWAAGMLIVILGLGAAVLRGEVGAILFMVIWLAAASVGLIAGARQLRRLTFGPTEPPKAKTPRSWHDGISDR